MGALQIITHNFVIIKYFLGRDGSKNKILFYLKLLLLHFNVESIFSTDAHTNELTEQVSLQCDMTIHRQTLALSVPCFGQLGH